MCSSQKILIINYVQKETIMAKKLLKIILYEWSNGLLS
jgi:hypothetical protein